MRRALVLLVALLLAGVIVPLRSHAAEPVLGAGDPDPGWGVGGTLSVDGSGYDHYVDSAVDAAGRMVSVAEANMRDNPRGAVVTRHLADGTPDPGFGEGGVHVLPRMDPSGIAARSDGSLLVTGTRLWQARPEVVLVRLTAAGDIDTAFGGDGLATIGGAYEDPSAHRPTIAVDGADRAVLAWEQDGPTGLGLARFTSDGVLDPTFGNGGQRSEPLSGTPVVGSVQVLPDGRILVGASSQVDQAASLWVRRYLADGAPDATWGSGGIAVRSTGAVAYAGDATPVPGGGVVIVGTVLGANVDTEAVAARFTATGHPDATFGTGGLVVVRRVAQEAARATSVESLGDGRVVVAGSTGTTWDGGADTFVSRLTAGGGPDGSFGASGTTVVELAPRLGRDGAEDLIRSDDGSLTVTGLAGSDSLVARFTSGGALVWSTTTDLGSDNDDRAGAVAQAPDGDYLVAGGTGFFNGVGDFMITRLRADGSRETDFGTEGEVVLDIAWEWVDSVEDIEVLADGSFAVAGSRHPPGNSFHSDVAVARFDAAGNLDTAFGDEGIVLLDFGARDTAEGIEARPGGGFVVAGTTFDGLVDNGFVLAVDADGDIDTSFGSGGAYVEPQARYAGMAMAADGKPVVVGTTQSSDTLVRRFTTAGRPDPTFGTSGRTVIDGQSDHGTAVAFDLVGRIVVGSGTGRATHHGTRISRLDGAGGLDPSFATGGTATYRSWSEPPTAMAVDDENRIVFAGRNIMGRVTAGGVADPEFDGDGIRSFYPTTTDLEAMLVDDAGRIVVAGDADGDAVVARVVSDGVQPPVTGADVVWAEGSPGNPVIGFSLAEPRPFPVRAAWRVVAGTATAGQVYEGGDFRGDMGGVFEIPAGATSTTVDVLTWDDSVEEGPEQYTITLSEPEGAALPDTTVVVTILDNDTPLVSVQDVATAEGDSATSAVQVPLALSKPVTRRGTVDYTTEAGTATAGSDFTAGSGTVAVEPGQPVPSIPVTVLSDTAVEPNETFVVRLSSPVDIALADDTAVVTVTNDDTTPTTTPTTSTPTTTTPTSAAPPPGPPPPPAPPPPARSGYWMVDEGGSVHAFGDAVWRGNAPVGGTPAVDVERTRSGNGYWVVDAAGRVFAFGDAVNRGGSPTLVEGETVAGLSAVDGGYWLFTTRGRAVPYGAVGHFGDMGGVALNGPVLDSVATPSGRGYYMVASDGGVFAFGDARFHGSMGSTRLNAPVQSLVPDPDGAGYWLVASDGGIFAFGAPFHGSTGSTRLNRPVSGMVGYPRGYLMVAEDGGIFAFGDARFHGSLGSNPPPRAVISVTALRD